MATVVGSWEPTIGDKVWGPLSEPGATQLTLANGSIADVYIERTDCNFAEARRLLGAA